MYWIKKRTCNRNYFSRNLTHFMRSLCPKQSNGRVMQKTCANARHSGGIVLKLFSIALGAAALFYVIRFTPITNKIIFFKYASNGHSLHPPPKLKYYHYYLRPQTTRVNKVRRRWRRRTQKHLGTDDELWLMTKDKRQASATFLNVFPPLSHSSFSPTPQNLIA